MVVKSRELYVDVIMPTPECRPTDEIRQYANQCWNEVNAMGKYPVYGTGVPPSYYEECTVLLWEKTLCDGRKFYCRYADSYESFTSCRGI